MQNFRALGAFSPSPQPPAAGGSAPTPQNSSPSLRISGYAPGTGDLSLPLPVAVAKFSDLIKLVQFFFLSLK